MRKKLGLILLIVLIGGALVFGFLKTKGLSKKTTIEQLKKIKTEHGQLLSASYRHGGGMNGDSFSQTIRTEKDGTTILEVRESSEYWIPIRVWEYLIDDEEVYVKLRNYIDEYNLSAWKDLPFDEEMIALDAPSSSIGLVFNDEAYGGSRMEYCTISYENYVPEGGYEVLNGFVSLIESYCREEKLIRTYLDVDGDRIFTGRDIENSDEEIAELIKGNWYSTEYGEDGYSAYGLYTAPYDEEMDLYRRGGDRTTLQDEEIIHEPLSAYDSSWHLILKDQNDPGSLYYLTLEKDRLYLETPEKETIEFTRK